MRWLLDSSVACFDCETTGIRVEEDRIVTATVALAQPGTPWSVDVRSWLVDPLVEIPPEATAIHGITTAQVREHGERPVDAVNAVAEELNRMFVAGFPVVVMNGSFDFTILDRECRRHDLPTVDERLGSPIAPVVDVYCIDKWLDPYRTGGRKLTDLIRFYNVKHEGAHDSTSDALAAGRVAYRMALLARSGHETVTQFFRSLGRRKPQEFGDRAVMLADMTPRELHRNQVGWRAEQQDSLREYLIGKGERNPDCDPHWPVKPYQIPEEVNQG